jgi:hypothetical protein
MTPEFSDIYMETKLTLITEVPFYIKYITIMIYGA